MVVEHVRRDVAKVWDDAYEDHVPDTAIHYMVQHGKGDPVEAKTMSLPTRALGDTITVGTVRSCCPVPGKFDFSFKALAPHGRGVLPREVPLQDQESSFVWVHAQDSEQKVPFFHGEIFVLLSSQTQPDWLTSESTLLDADGLEARAQPFPTFTSADGVQSLIEFTPISSTPSPESPGEDQNLQEPESTWHHDKPVEPCFQEAKRHAESRLRPVLDAWAFGVDEHGVVGDRLRSLLVLLSSLQAVLWEDSEWEPVEFADLVIQPGTTGKRNWRRALLMCHPDKHMNSPAEVQVRAEYITDVLTKAFREFKS